MTPASPAAPAELAFAGVGNLLDLMRRGEVTSRALVELFLRRIADLDPRLHAFQTVFAAAARTAADDADARYAAGAVDDLPPLLGLPIAVKDNVAIAGTPTGYGTRSPELPASFDAEVVRRLRAAGAVILGTTTMPELALLPHGPARNPWDPDRTSGGSSSGSAAAVAAGLVPAATASDGGGSIRLPAALCGLVGLKPTPGTVPLGPDREHWCGMSAAGFLTRTVADTALLLDVVRDRAGAADDWTAAATSRPGPLRIGLTRSGARTVRTVPLFPAVFGALDDTAGTLARLGHAVGPVEPAIGVLQGAFLPRYLRGARDDAARLVDPSTLGAPARIVTWLGRWVGDRQVAAAQRRSDRLRARMLTLFRTIDVLLMPTVSKPAGDAAGYAGASAVATLADSGDQVLFTSPWNVVGFPAVSVPAGLTEDGLPLAVQLVGVPGSEPTLLALAAQLETEGDWPARRPPL